ncbi:amidohydrolase family protein [Novosphingobium bradum]|uniref:Amidohydrolase family protein n=1 Tax=Novosphingobium bradum TaxID=1737444 RepID=A0ABV7IN60_9SPHN
MSDTATLDRFSSPDVKVAPEIGYALFDADSHYYEPEDALTRHLPKEWRRRGPKWAEINGRKRLILGDQVFNYIPNSTFDPIAKPGCAHDYFAAKLGGKSLVEVMGDLEPIANRPEYRDRDARIKVMNEQGVGATWLFPTLAVGLEVSWKHDPEAFRAVLRAFNRWLVDDWGMAYQDRIFGIPVITLGDPAWALEEVEWAIKQGARIISLRNGPIYTSAGTTSPGAPEYDPIWARCEEAGIVVAPHAGDDGYDFLGAMWEPWSDRSGFHVTPLQKCVTSQRAVPDFFAAVFCHKVFERFPRLRMASVENGAAWVAPLLTRLYRGYAQVKGYYQKNPVDQFHEHLWVTPFWEDNLDDLSKVMPVERIIFGSDWPHVEGVEKPVDFFKEVKNFSPEDQRKIMRENVAALTATANV